MRTVALLFRQAGRSLTLAGLVLFTACTSPTPSATAVVRVVWPQSLIQEIPPGAQSIVVTVRSADSQADYDTLTLNKPTAEGRIKAPVGQAVFVAKAYEQADGKGRVLAKGSTRAQIVAGQELNSSIAECSL